MTGRPGEFELIRRYFRPLATTRDARALTDDAAELRFDRGGRVVVTTDTVAAGVHFFADDPPAAIARKALRVNVSDLAAKGAKPFGYFLSIALPADWTPAWLSTFSRALKRDQAAFGMSLLGGDTLRSPDGLVISITALGHAGRRGMIERGGAGPGDVVFVSGTIGDAWLGYRLSAEFGFADKFGRGAAKLINRYLVPQPRVGLIEPLRRHARAALDVSDGLIADLGHLCAASGVGAVLDLDALPLSPPAARWAGRSVARKKKLASGGDDYEVLAAVDAKKAVSFARAAVAAGVPVTAVGSIVASSAATVSLTANGRQIASTDVGGHRHF